MADRISENLQDKISARLRFYQDIGIDLFYRNRTASAASSQLDLPASQSETINSVSIAVVAEYSETVETLIVAEPSVEESPVLEDTVPRTPRKPLLPAAPALQVPAPPKVVLSAPKSGLFDATSKISGDSLLKIRDDIGDCTRCKLHKARNKIVFADGNPKAKLVFVGEGPGRDEDMQGLPFVGRAGKLLTQMIEAMGLQRQDVYICNVVKCRPPENRLPEPDEIKTCSPFLLRQLDAVDPQVIVALGACAAQTLLQTTRGISHFRGQWQEFGGRKLMATYHPAYLLRNPPAKADVWKDLQMVMVELGLEVKRGAKSTSAGKPS
ncbi:MAG TPA: uracil-DNA glycosylase [Candidatus Eremiobacteraceae bacterium]|jgi:uracil-DNA glycosylase family 4|nr:uracil-DNA glycosylase [Candidatus Eremiobacteraceae bacterium]